MVVLGLHRFFSNKLLQGKCTSFSQHRADFVTTPVGGL